MRVPLNQQTAVSLHAHQQNPKFKGKNKTVASGWMRALSHALLYQLKGDFQNLFHNKEFPDEEISRLQNCAPNWISLQYC